MTKDTVSTLDDSYIKLYLTDQNDTLLKDVSILGRLSDHDTYSNSKYLYGNSITSNNNVETVHNYRLRIWVNEKYDTGYNTTEDCNGSHQSSTSEKTYKFTVNIATGKIPSNLADGWKTNNSASYLALYTIDTKTLPETYSYNGTVYTLDKTYDVSEQGNGNVMLGEYRNEGSIIGVIAQDGSVVLPESSSNLFFFLSNLIFVDLSSCDSTKTTDMAYMFRGCDKLETVDLTDLDTSNLTSMLGIFMGCSSLQEVTVGCNWQDITSNYMFETVGISGVTKVCSE